MGGGRRVWKQGVFHTPTHLAPHTHPTAHGAPVGWGGSRNGRKAERECGERRWGGSWLGEGMRGPQDTSPPPLPPAARVTTPPPTLPPTLQELDRNEKRLSTLQSVRPQYMDELERLQGELNGLYTSYLDKFRCGTTAGRLPVLDRRLGPEALSWSCAPSLPRPPADAPLPRQPPLHSPPTANRPTVHPPNRHRNLECPVSC